MSHGMDSDGSCQNSQDSDASCMSVPLGWATLLMLKLVVNIIHSVIILKFEVSVLTVSYTQIQSKKKKKKCCHLPDSIAVHSLSDNTVSLTESENF